MSRANVIKTKKFKLSADSTIRNSKPTVMSLAELMNAGHGVEIDCAGVDQADITFVQTLVSAQRSFASRDLPFALSKMSAAARSAFERAGVAQPGVASSEPSRD